MNSEGSLPMEDELERDGAAVEGDINIIVQNKSKKKKKVKKSKDDNKLPDISQSVNMAWVRMTDDRQNVYYYNSISGASSWLGPCNVCSMISVKWCLDCGKSYCDKDYETCHNEKEVDDNLKHTWATTEISAKDTLQPEEVYCIKCAVKAASRICTDCWDPYCADCFRLTHNVGYLKKHVAVAYSRAKLGWICVRSDNGRDPDYYVNGATQETTFEKPWDLMTELERVHLRNFRTHKEAAEEHVQLIEKLQFELEAVKYERDNLIVQSLHNGGGGVAKKGSKDDKKSVLDSAKSAKGGGGIAALLGGKDNPEYREQLMNPSDRRRGQARTDYIKNLLDTK